MSEQAARIKAAVERDAAAAEEPEPSTEPAAPEESNPPTDPAVEPGTEPTEVPDTPEPEAPAEEPGEQTQPEPPPAAPEPTPDSGQLLGAADAGQVEELEKAQTTYLRKVEKVIGSDAMPPLCEHCQGTGLDFTGGAPEPEFRPSPDRERCPDCDGWGKVTTGSRVLTEEVLPCPTCQGAGHRVILPAPPVLQPTTAAAAAPVPPGAAWMGNPALGSNG